MHIILINPSSYTNFHLSSKQAYLPLCHGLCHVLVGQHYQETLVASSHLLLGSSSPVPENVLVDDHLLAALSSFLLVG